KDQGIVKVLNEIELLKLLEMWVKEGDRRGKEEIALAQIRLLDTAVNNYRMHYKKLPVGLQALAEVDPDRGAAILDDEALIDPWGRGFRYDAAGPKNKGTKPDIWTTDPSGKTIGNWGAQSA